MEISDKIVEDLSVFLQEDGIRWFKHLKGLTGTYSPVLKLNMKRKGIPAHPVHLREGMQIRNWLRNREECKDWNDHDFDNNWTLVIDKVVEKYGNKDFNN